MLRHRSLLSSRPYVTDAARTADLAATKAAAAPSRPVPMVAVGLARTGAPGPPVPPAGVTDRERRVPLEEGPGARPHLAVPRGLGERPPH